MFLIEDRGQTYRVLILVIQTLTCDLQFQSPVSHDSDPHACKRSRPKVSQFKNRVETDGRDEQTDGGDCITSYANAVGNQLIACFSPVIILYNFVIAPETSFVRQPFGCLVWVSVSQLCYMIIHCSCCIRNVNCVRNYQTNTKVTVAQQTSEKQRQRGSMPYKTDELYPGNETNFYWIRIFRNWKSNTRRVPGF